MPHMIIECTDNIKQQADFPTLFKAIHGYMAQSPLFPIAGVRSRVHWLDTWQMADGERDYAFVHFHLRIGHGRSLAEREQAGQDLFEIITNHFEKLYDNRLLAISFEISEVDPHLTYKKNDKIHQLFK